MNICSYINGLTLQNQDEATCRTRFVHEDAVRSVYASTPDEETLNSVADFFRMLGDPTRMKIVHALFVSEMCVCDLSEILQVSQSAVSHQLKTLRQTGMVVYRREGKVVFYSLKDEHMKRIIDLGLQHITET
jgi:DNA-binding transcriptional ArsR family regulator